MKRKIIAAFLLCWIMAIGGISYAAFGAMIDVPLPRCWPVPPEGCPQDPPALCWGFVYVCQTLIWPFEFCWYQLVPVPCDTQQ